MDDNDDDEYSVGSARGSIGGHSRLGGLGGLRPVGKDLGGLGGPSSKGNSPSKDPGGLGGLGSKGNSPSKDPPRSGLGGLSRAGPKAMKGISAPKLGGIGGLKIGAAISSPAVSGLAAVKVSSDTTDATVEALKNITSLVQSLSEKTLLGFKDVSNRLNQETGGDVQPALDELVKHIDEEISAKKNSEIYLIIPGSEPRTLTSEEATNLIKDKSVRVFGGIGGIATITGA